MTIVPKFMWSWPSWLTELVSGLVTDVLAGVLLWLITGVAGHLAAPAPLALLFLATALSFVYETQFDEHGFEWKDVGQRQVGILFGVVVWWQLR